VADIHHYTSLWIYSKGVRARAYYEQIILSTSDTKGGGRKGERRLSGAMSALWSVGRARNRSGFSVHHSRSGTKK
jgi:hypothetical protein